MNAAGGVIILIGGAAVHQMIKLTAVVREDLPQVRQPAPIFGAKDDLVVDQRDPELLYNQIGLKQKELIWLEHSLHVAPLDYDKGLLLERIVKFVRSFEKDRQSKRCK